MNLPVQVEKRDQHRVAEGPPQVADPWFGNDRPRSLTVHERARICSSSWPAAAQLARAGPAASSLSSWPAVQRSWVSRSAVTSSVGGCSGVSRPEIARARSSQVSTDSGRSAAISAATAAAARLDPVLALEVCRSTLPNRAW